MLDLLLGDMTTVLIALGGVAVALLGVYAKGRGDQKSKDHRERLETYIETSERIDDAETVNDMDGAKHFLSERLRRRGK